MLLCLSTLLSTVYTRYATIIHLASLSLSPCLRQCQDSIHNAKSIGSLAPLLHDLVKEETFAEAFQPSERFDLLALSYISASRLDPFQAIPIEKRY